MNDILLNTSDVAKILGVCDQSVRNYIKAGELKARKIGKSYKVLETEVIQFINECNERKEKVENE